MDVREKLAATCKLGEKGCWQDGKCHYRLECENKVLTNADRIRSMSDEELAEFLCSFRSCDADEYICEGCKAEKYCRAGHTGTIEWLQQPAEEGE